MTKKKWIAAAITAILFIGMLVFGYIAKSSEKKTEPPASEEITLAALVDVAPENVWNVDDAEDDPTFTTRDQLPADADSIGVLVIEKIGLQCHVYDSDESSLMEDMKRGAAHYKSTSYWNGNIGFSAHNGNASYSFFDRLPELAEGDIIIYETALGTRQYTVTTIADIADDDWQYLGRTDDNRITLTTCITGQPAMRLCVQAVEV